MGCIRVKGLSCNGHVHKSGTGYPKQMWVSVLCIWPLCLPCRTYPEAPSGAVTLAGFCWLNVNPKWLLWYWSDATGWLWAASCDLCQLRDIWRSLMVAVGHYHLWVTPNCILDNDRTDIEQLSRKIHAWFSATSLGSGLEPTFWYVTRHQFPANLQVSLLQLLFCCW